MRLHAFLPAALAAGCLLAAAPASAGLVITFDYDGEATVGGVTSTLTTTTDVNNATRYFSPADPSSGLIRDRASLINFADNNPFVFAAGAATGGTANADARMTVTVDITNDTGAATEFLWQGLIFAGGVGFAVPDYDAEGGCNQESFESCGAYQVAPFTVGSAELASIQFVAALAGVELFSGAASVSDTGPSSTFNNIALNGFGPAAGNANFLSWDPTNFSQSLGVFAAGETRTLTFTIIASANTLRSFCIPSQPASCLLAMAGFGDPPGGAGGGVILDSGGGQRSVSFSFIGPAADLPVPVPPAMLLFGTALAAFGARKAVKKRA